MKQPKKKPTKQPSLAKLKAKAQSYFNRYIRERDKQDNGKWVCISCGREFDKIHAGHYFPVKHYDWLRFDEDNVHSQCVGCNTFRDGNLIAYRFNLLKKIGKKRLEILEWKGLGKERKLTRSEVEGILDKYMLICNDYK